MFVITITEDHKEPLSLVITDLKTYTHFEESLQHLPDCADITRF